MYNENQLVKIKWSNKMKKYYKSKGYTFTKYGDCFFVQAKDLPKNSKEKIEVVCDYCGKTYYTSMVSFVKRENKTKDACNNCRAYKQWDNTYKQRAKDKFDIVKKICHDNDYELITHEDEFIGAYTPIKYICKKHGVQTQSLDNIIHGHRCYFCSYEERGLNCRHSKEEVKRIVNGINGNVLLNPDEYVGVFEKNLRIKCGECGEVYITNLENYMRKNQTRCPHCSKSESVGEFCIRKFLEKHNIWFEQEKTFEGCKDIKALPFDFYLPDYNLIIEFDGQIHYFEVGYGNHEKTVIHDKIKNEYCKNNDINLLRIPYWEGNNIEKIITKQLNL